MPNSCCPGRMPKAMSQKTSVPAPTNYIAEPFRRLQRERNAICGDHRHRSRHHQRS